MTLETAPVYLVAVLVLGILVGFGVALRRYAPGARRIGHAIDDIIGEEARPGIPARPGIVERQATLEEHLASGFADHATRFDRLEATLTTASNGTAARLDEHGRRLDDQGHRLGEHGRRLDALTLRIDTLHPPPDPGSTPDP